MEITRDVPVERVADGIRCWELKSGLKAVSAEIALTYQERGGGELLPAVGSDNWLRNSSQRVRRIFSLDGRYREQAEALKSVALAAMPKRRRLEVTTPNAPELATARVMESWSEVLVAITIRCPSAVQKITQLMTDMQALIPVIEPLLH
ncbi:hypothetical protein [Citrobacter meridianamericanus]|uniref:Uncharacterized protein n=1 Tax=Citrobacter meridianamericanus TaxID=2894201 RepID=A0ABT1B6V4_9ENTR|nr:hypothetical protein [Citrobacter meridianamericanus]MCO5781600.1 hypothetical protein [Citrobacter meridianamericanus]